MGRVYNFSAGPAVLPEEVLRRQVSEELFERDYTTIEERIRDYKLHN